MIKLEQPGKGDTFRHFDSITERDGDSLIWLSEARNKTSITLDLRQAEGKALFQQLEARSDVVAENLVSVTDKLLGEVVVPGVVPKLSASPGRVDHLGPRLGDASMADCWD